MHPPSPVLALTMLVAFTERHVALTREVYDDLFDTVLAALEKANDETFRLQDVPTEVP